MAVSKNGTPADAAPQAPGAKVVKALANDTAATFVVLALDEARAAYRSALESRTFPDGGGPTGLSPTEAKFLEVLEGHRDQLIAATTAPPVTGGEK